MDVTEPMPGAIAVPQPLPAPVSSHSHTGGLDWSVHDIQGRILVDGNVEISGVKTRRLNGANQDPSPEVEAPDAVSTAGAEATEAVAGGGRKKRRRRKRKTEADASASADGRDRGGVVQRWWWCLASISNILPPPFPPL